MPGLGCIQGLPSRPAAPLPGKLQVDRSPTHPAVHGPGNSCETTSVAELSFDSQVFLHEGHRTTIVFPPPLVFIRMNGWRPKRCNASSS
jgi:hypothetical protein